MTAKEMDSPFSSLFDTNHEPSEAEVVSIKAFLAEPQAKLTKLDAEIFRIQQALEGLHEQRHTVVTFIEKHRAIVSPIRRLPQEILSEIFVQCLPKDRAATATCYEAPILLTHVTQKWRKIALSTPHLWSSIHISMLDSSAWRNAESTVLSEICNARLKAFCLWLERSRELPLQLSLHESEYTMASEPHHDVLGATQLVLPRIRWLDLSLSEKLLPWISSLPSDRFPSLEVLRYSVPTSSNRHGGSDSKRRAASMCGFLAAPKLREVDLVHINIPILQLPLRWSQLTRLSILIWSKGVMLTSQSLLILFSRCPSLQSCRLHVNGRGDQDPPVSFDGIIVLSKLEALTLEHEGDIEDIFKYLSFPCLNEVSLIGGQHESGSAGKSPLKTLLSRHPHHKIQKLKTHAKIYPRQELIECLKMLPLLRSLLLPRPPSHDEYITPPESLGTPRGFDNHVLQLMIPISDNDTTCLCPLLDNIEFLSDLNITTTALVRFAHAKNEYHQQSPDTIAKLKQIKVPTNGSLHPDPRSMLGSLIEGGLRFVIASPEILTWKPPPPSYGLWDEDRHWI